MVWQYSWQRLTALKTFCLQTATLLSVLAIGLKNIWRLTGTSTSCSWLSLSVILCVVVYDNRSKSIMAMSLHMNLCALFMIWVFPSLCSRLAWCSRKMLLVPSLRQSTSPLLWCVVKYKVSWYISLSFIFSHFLEYGRILSGDWSNSMSWLPSQNLFIYFLFFYFIFLYNYLSKPELEQVFLSFPMGVEFQHFKTCYYTPLQTYLWKKLLGIYVHFHLFINIASLYEMMEEWLPSWINANSTSVQYTYFFVVMICCSRHHANCMWGLMFIV